MAEQAQMLISWTPSSDATSQEVHRSLSSSGPWTVIATVGASVSSFTDITVDPTPFTTYYYKIKTICADGSSDSLSNYDVCQNCPTSGNSFIFGARNLESSDMSVQFTSGTNKWINTNYTPSPLLATTKSLGVPNPPSNTSKVLFCAECGEDVNISWQPTEFGTPPGSPSNSDFSYMEQQGHLASHLPTPPSGLGGSANYNLGTVTRKMTVPGQLGSPGPGRFQIGIGNPGLSTFTAWNGGYVASYANSGNPAALPASFRWNYGEVPYNNGTAQGGFTQIRIDKRIFTWSPVAQSGDQSFALGAMTGSNVYMSIIEIGNTGSGINGQSAYNNGHLRCEHYIYKLTRNSSYDTADSTGFSMLGQASVAAGGYRIYGGALTHGNDFLPYTQAEQPNVYLKIFTI